MVSWSSILIRTSMYDENEIQCQYDDRIVEGKDVNEEDYTAAGQEWL